MKRLVLLLILMSGWLFAAWLNDVPQRVVQPDGSVIECLASGDEFHNWLHDEDGYTLMLSPETGYLVYAVPDGEGVKASSYRYDQIDPASVGIEKHVNISTEAYKARRRQSPLSDHANQGNERTATTGTLHNIVVYIRFADQTEFTVPIATYDDMFNHPTDPSFRTYYEEVSDGQLTVDGMHYPPPAGGTVVSYQDSHNRNYFCPYDSLNNPDGYNNDDDDPSNNGGVRERQMLRDAFAYINSIIPPDEDFDGDNDGYVDNVNLVVRGSVTAWADVLWPHATGINTNPPVVNGATVGRYNLQLENSMYVGVICHEFFHTLGAPDLYHYSDASTYSPAGKWDLMNSQTWTPQHMLTHMKWKYGQWFTNIPQISTPGTYTLQAVSQDQYACYKIPSIYSSTEFFMLEFRKQEGDFESNLPSGGLLVYRIDTDAGNGNAGGPPDEVYVYRPGGVSQGVTGDLDHAPFCVEHGRTEFNQYTDPSPFLQWGGYGGLILTDIGSASGNTISFTIASDIPPMWTGEVSSNWHDPDNWSGHELPDDTDDVIIPPSPNDPILLYQDASVHSLVLQSGATLTVPNHDLQVLTDMTVHGELQVMTNNYGLTVGDDLYFKTDAILTTNQPDAYIHVWGDIGISADAYFTVQNGTISMVGGGDAIIWCTSSYWRLNNLTIDKPGATVHITSEFSEPLRINGNLTITTGTTLQNVYVMNDLVVGGDLICDGLLQLDYGELLMTGTDASLELTSGCYVNDFRYDPFQTQTLYVNGELVVNGDLDLHQAEIDTGGWSITLKGDYTQSSGVLNLGYGFLKIKGTEDQHIEGEEVFGLELNKPAGEMIIENGDTFTCEAYNWTQGTLHVVDGNFIAESLSDDSIRGNFILDDGLIELHQSSSQGIDINGDVRVHGGVFEIHGGNADSDWAHDTDTLIQVDGDGYLKFMDHGIHLEDNDNDLIFAMTGGELGTAGDFIVERPSVYFFGGSLNMIGTADAEINLQSTCELWSLEIDKSSLSRAQSRNRINQVTITSDLEILGALRVVSGALHLEHAQLDITAYSLIQGSLYMSHADDILNIGESLHFMIGSSGDLTAGEINLMGNLYVNVFSDVQVGAACPLTMTGTSSAFIESNSDSATLGDLIIDKTSGDVDFSNQSTEPLVVSNDLRVTSYNSFIVNNADLNVGGTTIIENNGLMDVSSAQSVTTGSLTLNGTLNVEGTFTMDNAIVQGTTGELNIDGGSFVDDRPYVGSLESFSGTTSIDGGGAFQITNNGLQFGATSELDLIDGTVRVGWMLRCIHEGAFQQNTGAFEFIGARAGDIDLAPNNWFNDLIINKPLSNYTVYTNDNLHIKGDLYCNGGKLDCETALVEGDVNIESGYLSVSGADDVLTLRGSWNNTGGVSHFIEGSGTVIFTHPVTTYLSYTETFYNLIIDKDYPSYALYVGNYPTITVENDLTVQSGALALVGGPTFEVQNDVWIQTDATLSGTYDDDGCSFQIDGNMTIDSNGKFDMNQAMIATVGGTVDMDGLLLVDDSELTVAGSFDSGSVCEIEINTGSLILDEPDIGSWFLLRGDYTQSGGLLQVTNRDLQLLTGGDWNVSGGVMRTGGSFYCNAPSFFHPTGGTLEFIGSGTHYVTCSNGNWIGGLRVNSTGGTVNLGADLIVKGDVTLDDGVFYPGGNGCYVHGDWTNNAGPAAFGHNGTTITFSGDGQSVVTNGETFSSLDIEKTMPGGDDVVVPAGQTLAITYGISINQGQLQLNDGAILDVSGGMSVEEDASLDALDSEAEVGTTIRLAGYWWDGNTTSGPDAGFNPGYSHIIVDGNVDQTINFYSGQFNCHHLTIDKAGGQFTAHEPVVCSGDFNLLNGSWDMSGWREEESLHDGQPGGRHVHQFLGDFSVASGASWMDDTGTVQLAGSDNSDLLLAGTCNFGTFKIDKNDSRNGRDGGWVSLSGDSSLPAGVTFDIVYGALDLNGYRFETESGIDILNEAVLMVDGGATLALGDGVNVNVESGGALGVLGDIAPATVTHISTGYGAIWVHSGGLIGAQDAIFEYLGTSGVCVNMGATVDESYTFNGCTFRNGINNGTLLTINTDDVVVVDGAVFPTNTWGGMSNVRKNLDLGSISFINESGGFVGFSYEDDMFNRVNWTGDAPDIDVSETLLAYGNVQIGSDSTLSFDIDNTGSARLIGTVTVPDGFWVSEGSFGRSGFSQVPREPGRDRNELEFDLEPGYMMRCDVMFQPWNAGAYDDYAVIDHNATGTPDQVHLTGAGSGPEIYLDPDMIMAESEQGASVDHTLTIGNRGTETLNYVCNVMLMRENRDILVETSFEYEFPPMDWTNEDLVDSLGSVPWTDTYSYVHNGSKAALASYMMTDDTRLITPQFTATSDGNLSYWIRSEDSPIYGGDFAVEISTDGSNWTALESFGQNSLSQTWAQRNIGLSAYEGQVVQIGFHAYNNLWGNGVVIDDVSVTGTPYTPDWLLLEGGMQYSGNIPAGAPDVDLTVSLDSSELPEGWYMGGIDITSNDPLMNYNYVMVDYNVGHYGISVDWDSINYVEVPVGQTSTMYLTIENTGTINLQTEITAPAGFSVAEYVRGTRNGQNLRTSAPNTGTRNTLFSEIDPWMSLSLEVTFEPTAAVDYLETMLIQNSTGTDVPIILEGYGIDVPVVTTGTPTGITGESAIGHGTVTDTGNVAIFERGFCVSELPDPTMDDWLYIAPSGDAGPFSVELTDLMYDQTYHVRAYAINSLGTSYGQDVEFQTAAPQIFIVESSVDFGNVEMGASSGTQSVTISGTNLIAEVYVTTPPGFFIDDGARELLAMTTLIPVNGTLAPTQLNLVCMPQIPGPVTDSLIASSTATENVSIPLSGTGIYEPVVTTDAAVATDSYTIVCTLSIVDDGFAPIVDCGAAWNTSGDSLDTDGFTIEGPQTGTVVTTISGLSSDTDYWIRAWAENEVGVVYGSQILVHTPPNPTVNASVEYLYNFGTEAVGSVTSAQVFTVSGFDLQDDLIVIAPPGFGLSDTNPHGNREFSGTMTITPENGIVSDVSVYCRFEPMIAGQVQDYILVTSAGATTDSVQVNAFGIDVPQLDTAVVTAITHETATSGGTVLDNGYSAVTACGVCWGMTTEPTIDSDDYTDEGAQSGSFVSQMTGLQPEQLYYVRSWAQNAAGVSYGPELQFTTLGIPSIDPPQNLTIQISGGDVLLSWDPVAAAGSYHVFRSDSPDAVDWGAPVHTTDDTSWSEPIPAGGPWFYRVTSDTQGIVRRQ